MFNKYARQYFQHGMKVLEIGPDNIPSTYQHMIGDSSIIWHTLDIRTDKRLSYSGCEEYSFPIPDNTYDIVLSGQVLEHVGKIWLWIKEVARVCRREGIVITINPAVALSCGSY
jgi:SAM-dependent methyltransferase